MRPHHHSYVNQTPTSFIGSNPAPAMPDWLTRYRLTMRHLAVERLFPRYDAPLMRKTTRVLDVGCGDGRFGAWVEEQFRVEVTGIDLVDHPGVRDRLSYFERRGAEGIKFFPFPYNSFDLALLVDVLPSLKDYRRVLSSLRDFSRFVLIVGEMQTPAPAHQPGQPHLRHVPLPQLLDDAKAIGYEVDEIAPVTILDRQLFGMMPHALQAVAYAASALLDTAMTSTHLFHPWAHEWAVLLRNPFE